MGAPEFVFVEALPDRVFFDVQHEFGVALLDLDALRFDDRRNAVSARAHSRAVDFVAGIGQHEGADHLSFFLGVQVQLFAQGVERHLHVFDHRIAFALPVEGFFLRALDRVLEQIEQTSQAGGFLLIDQLLAAHGDQHRLHVDLGLREVEQLPPVAAGAHFQEAFRFVVADVRQRARGDVEIRIASFVGVDDEPVGQPDQIAERFLVALARLGFLAVAVLTGRFTSSFRHWIVPRRGGRIRGVPRRSVRWGRFPARRWSPRRRVRAGRA